MIDLDQQADVTDKAPTSSSRIEVCVDLVPGMSVRMDRCIGDVPLMEVLTDHARVVISFDMDEVIELGAQHVTLAEEFANAACELRDELRDLVAAR